MVSDHSLSSMVYMADNRFHTEMTIDSTFSMQGKKERLDLFGIQMRKEPQAACFTFNILFFLFGIPHFTNSCGLRALGGAVGVRTGSPA